MIGNDANTAGPKGPVDRFLETVRAGIFWCGVAAFSLTLGALFAALFVNVVLRYAFARGISWAHEIPFILFPWTVGGAIIVATCLGRNIQISLLTNTMSAGLRRAVAIGVHTITAAVCLGVVWTSAPILDASKLMRLAETGIAQFYGMLGIVVAFVAIAVVSLIDLVFVARGVGKLPAGEAETSLS